MYSRLILNPDGGERLRYNTPDFPVRTADGDLSSFLDYSAGCHWHRDFEFLLVREGYLDYFVNGEIVRVRAGQCAFVNSARLHYGFSPEKQECLYNVLVFHPSVLGEIPMPTARCAEALGADGSRDCILFDPADETGAEVVRLVRAACELGRAPGEATSLRLQSMCANLVALLWETARPETPAPINDPAWAALRAMTGYLQANFAQRVCLAEIAAAGAVCRSKCCRLFRERLHTTPMEYLTRYRLEKACALLRETALPITEIAQQCGFDGASYFAETFRKTFGVTPRQARRTL